MPKYCQFLGHTHRCLIGAGSSLIDTFCFLTSYTAPFLVLPILTVRQLLGSATCVQPIILSWATIGIYLGADPTVWITASPPKGITKAAAFRKELRREGSSDIIQETTFPRSRGKQKAWGMPLPFDVIIIYNKPFWAHVHFYPSSKLMLPYKGILSLVQVKVCLHNKWIDTKTEYVTRTVTAKTHLITTS